MKVVKPIQVKIQNTYDYDKFKLVGINRQVNKKHVVSIAEAILYRNLLHLFPVIINSNWEVMDGQHRIGSVKYIQVAKALQLPVYYILDPNIELDDMRLLNSNKINWKNQDYVNYYAAKGEKEFVRLFEFQKKHPGVPLSNAISLISSRKRDLGELKNGILTADKAEKAHYIMKCIYELRERMGSQIHLWKTGNFMNAMKDVIYTGKYRHHVMMKSPRNAPEFWEPQHTQRAYLIEINKTYNYGLTEQEKVDFLKLVKIK